MQPYAAAYYKYLGEREFKGYEYISWITRKHREFRKMKGLNDHVPYTKEQQEEFIRFINEE